MRIAILGATSQIAKDVILSFAGIAQYDLVLFARRPEMVREWLNSVCLSDKYSVYSIGGFIAQEPFDAIMNFIGVGNPVNVTAIGESIFDITLKHDEMVLNYLASNPACRYIFLSSGAVYGNHFESPVDENSVAIVPINCLQSQDWYGLAKMYAECRHRALPHLSIVDIRVFNYFSHTADISARFLMADILRAIRFNEILHTTSENIVRDYIGPNDFFRLISLILQSPARNDAVDCYTRGPVDKLTLLDSMKERFSLNFEIDQINSEFNATGFKKNYFSTNKRAAIFGYSPLRSSLEVVIDEIYLALNHK